MQNGTTTTKETAKALTPAELAEKLMDLAEDCIPWALKEKLRDAKAALETVQVKIDRAGEKKLRILRAKSIEEAQTILDENPADVNLKALCQRRTGWKPLQEKGASDEELKKFLAERGKGWAESRPYPHKIPSAEVDYRGAAVWVDPDKSPDGNAHLSGQKLVDAVRRVMGIPKPAAKPVAAATPKKSAPKKPSAGKAKPKAPATSPAKPTDADAGDDDEPAGGDPDAPIADSPEFDGLDDAAATLHAAETAWEEGPDAIENRSTFDANFERMQKATDALRAFLPLAVTPERAFALGTLVHETPWFKSLGVTDQARVSAMLSTQGNARLLHPLIRDGATNAQIKKALGRVLGISGGGWGGKGISYTYKGGEAPQITANGRTYKGEALIEKTRELLGIGAPGNHQRADKPVLPSVAALSKPQTPMPTPDDEDAPPIPDKPDGQSLTWYQWRNLFADGYHKRGEQRGLAHDSVGDEDFEPNGLLLDLYNRGLKPAAAAEEYVEHVARDHASDEAMPPAGDKPKLIDQPDTECRICGCTEDDCQECIEATGAPCRWVDDPIEQGDLCSRCKPAEYGRRVTGMLISGAAHGHELVITGQGVRGGHEAFQAQVLGGDAHVWIRKEGAKLGEQTLDGAGDDGDRGFFDDPNVDGRGVYVQGVREIVVRGSTKGDKARIVIRVARGADGMYRTGHLLEFVGAQAWQADSDEPVKVSSPEAELEWYAVKARANILINLIKAAPGKPGGGPGAAWSPEQRQTYNAAIEALELFIAHNPACRQATPAKPKPKAAIVA